MLNYLYYLPLILSLLVSFFSDASHMPKFGAYHSDDVAGAAGAYSKDMSLDSTISKKKRTESPSPESSVKNPDDNSAHFFLTPLKFDKKEESYVQVRESILRYLPLAQQNDVEAQYSLAMCYAQYSDLTNYYRAVEWLTRAENQGSINAAYALGLCFFHGYGIQKDKKQAKRFFYKASESNHAQAQYMLGICFLRDEPTEKDINFALDSFDESLKNGFNNASQALLDCAYKKNYPHAKFLVGIRYYHGNGLEQNQKEAIQLIKEAALAGHRGALTWLQTQDQHT